MRNPFAHITPGHLVIIGRLSAVLVAMFMTAGYVTEWLHVESTALAAFALAQCLLLGVPDQRSSELLGATAIWMTFAEFLAANQTGEFHLWRWAVAIAALAVVIIPLKIQHFRALARTNPYRTLADLDRRAIQLTPEVFPKSAGYLGSVRVGNEQVSSDS